MNLKGRIIRLERKHRPDDELAHLSDDELVSRIQHLAAELNQYGGLPSEIAAQLQTTGLWEASP